MQLGWAWQQLEYRYLHAAQFKKGDVSAGITWSTKLLGLT